METTPVSVSRGGVLNSRQLHKRHLWELVVVVRHNRHVWLEAWATYLGKKCCMRVV
jgi:hypothetical protein